jgi:hypothetical protein
MLMVGTDKRRRGKVGKFDRGSDIKCAGYGRINRNPPYMVFPAVADLKLAPRDRSTPLPAPILLTDGDELHPPTRWVYLTS